MRHMAKRVLILVLALTLVSATASVALGAQVTRDALPVYDAPSFAQEGLAGYLNSGEKVTVVEVRGDWAKITRDGKVGYTGVKYLEPETSADAGSSRVAGYALRPVTVYAEASTGSNSIASLPWGTRVWVVGTSGDFCKVENSAGTIRGYIPCDYLSRTQPSRTLGYATQEVSIYAEPSPNSEELALLPRGSSVYVIGTSGECCRVVNSAGTMLGYIYSDYLSRSPVSSKVTTGYATCDVSVYAEPSTSSSVLARLSRKTAVTVFDVNGSFCKVRNSSGTIVGYILASQLTQTPPSSGSSSSGSSLDQLRANVVKVDWYDSARYALSRGSYYTLYDIRNGQTIRVKYTTGSDHMDIEPATADDTAKLKALLGGEWTWERTPCILIAEGKYIAASLYGEPHGSTDTISGNNMSGVVCLHLSGSRTHGSDRVDEGHQAAIQAAYDWAHD